VPTYVLSDSEPWLQERYAVHASLQDCQNCTAVMAIKELLASKGVRMLLNIYKSRGLKHSAYMNKSNDRNWMEVSEHVLRRLGAGMGRAGGDLAQGRRR